MLTGEGATCVTMSHVLAAILRRLGYECYVGMALTRNKTGMEMLHFITFIQSVQTQGDLWSVSSS